MAKLLILTCTIQLRWVMHLIFLGSLSVALEFVSVKLLISNVGFY